MKLNRSLHIARIHDQVKKRQKTLRLFRKMKKTLIIGASTNPSRYSYKAAHKLKNNGHEIVPLGVKKGSVAGEKILNQIPEKITDIDTVTLYINPKIQEGYTDYILSLRPKRVIFNPGTENSDLQKKLSQKGIAFEESCTLVLLANGLY